MYFTRLRKEVDARTKARTERGNRLAREEHELFMARIASQNAPLRPGQFIPVPGYLARTWDEA